MSVDVVPSAAAVVPSDVSMTRMTPAQAREQAQWLRDVMSAVLTEGTDYGTIPGTEKPTLYKAGAELLLIAAGLSFDQQRIDDFDSRQHNGVTYRCTVMRGERAVAVCEGYAGYDESNFKRGRTSWNTIVKMSQKRALVGAALNAVAGSGLFIADLDDVNDRDGGHSTGAARTSERSKQALAAADPISKRVAALPAEQRAAYDAFMADRKLPWPSQSRAVVVQVDREVARLEALVKSQSGGAPTPDPTDSGEMVRDDQLDAIRVLLDAMGVESEHHEAEVEHRIGHSLGDADLPQLTAAEAERLIDELRREQ